MLANSQLFGPERQQEPLTRVTVRASPCRSPAPAETPQRRPRPAAQQPQHQFQAGERHRPGPRTAVQPRQDTRLPGHPASGPPPAAREGRQGEPRRGCAYPLHVLGAGRPPAGGCSAPWGDGARRGLGLQSPPLSGTRAPPSR